MARGPCGLDDLQFLAWRHAGEHPCGADRGGEAFRRESGQFISRDHGVGVMGQVELSGDGQTRQPVVAGDHHHPNPRRAALLHRLSYARPQRIREPDKTEKVEVGDRREERMRPGRGAGCGHAALRQRQHPQALGGECRCPFLPSGQLVAAADAHRQHGLRCALHAGQAAVRKGVKRGREAVLRLERQFVILRCSCQHGLPLDAELHSE